ncbi:MAG: MBL fold metallo-hydrolase [Clostridiales bacterium]|nr:MBL fold metallo-hydrolase [Clostridiales bacterium]
MNKSRKKIAIIDIIILVVLAIVLGVSMVWSRDIELKLGLLYYVDAEGVAEEDIVTLSSGVHTSADSSAELKVHFVNVGQGDCAIIELPDGKNMIIDAGRGTQKSNEAINYVQSYIKDTLGDGFKYFDYAILTHPDSDHCNILDSVLNMYPSYVCYRPNVEAKNAGYTDQGKADLTTDATTKSSAAYVNAIKSMYKEIDGQPNVVYVTDPKDESQTITGGTGNSAYTFTFYAPLSAKYTGDGASNNYSPIMILDYQGYKFAMSGDAEKKNLGEFVAKVQAAKTDGVTDKYDVFTDDYCVNVIKAGHHGSENATTLDYLNVLTTPSGVSDVYSVISCGAGNTYGHPHAAALDRIKAVGIPDDNVLRTDQKGDISFTVRVDEDGSYAMYCGDRKTQNPDAPVVTPDDPNDPDDPITPDNPNNPDDDKKPNDDNNNNPDDDKKPENPSDDDPEPVKIQVLVYRELGGIKLKWAVVAWSCYAVVVLAAAVHIVLSGHGKNGD